MADNDIQYAVGLDPNNLTPLNGPKSLKIPIPDQVVFTPASVYYYRADGTRVGDGFAGAVWVYDVISGESLYLLLEILDEEEYVYMYVRTDKRDGNYALPEDAFSVYYAIMYRPILSGEEGVPIARSSKAYQSVKIMFRLLSEHIEYI
jgi:hypothetical protein